MKRSGGAIRRALFKLERGVCTIPSCRLDCHALVKRLQTIEKGTLGYVDCVASAMSFGPDSSHARVSMCPLGSRAGGSPSGQSWSEQLPRRLRGTATRPSSCG